MSPHNPDCWADHMGLWAVEPLRFQAALSEFRAGRYQIQQVNVAIDQAAKAAPDPNADRFIRMEGGIAAIPMRGFMSKRSKFGASTVDTRAALRQARADKSIRGVLMLVDSPGGTVAGTQQLADDVAATNAVKPVWAQVEDLAASAALETISQAGRIFAEKSAEIGSIGTVAVVYDESQAFKDAGFKTYVVSTGPNKGAFTPGTKVTKDQLDALQTRVDAFNEFFLQALAGGRKMARDKVEALATGDIWIAAKAQELGLIDGVQSGDVTLAMLQEAVKPKKSAAEAAARLRLA